MKKTKTQIALSIDKKLSILIKKSITNRSKYIEWLVYQEMKKNNIKDIDKIIL